MTETAYLPILITLFVSLLFGMGVHLQNLGLDTLDARSGAIVNIGSAALVLWLLSPLYLPYEPLTPRAGAIFMLVGLVVPAVSLSLAMVSVRLIGPSLTSGLGSTSPVFAMILAVALLGEMVTNRILAGTMIVVGGIMIAAFRSRRGAASWPLWALGLPIGSAIARGTAHPLTKLGLLDSSAPVTAALIGSSVSLFVVTCWFLMQGNLLPRLTRGYAWFALCGLTNCLGVVLLNYALQMSEVVIVAPLIAAAPAFTLITGYLFFRREFITWRMVLSLAVIMCGCILILTR